MRQKLKKPKFQNIDLEFNVWDCFFKDSYIKIHTEDQESSVTFWISSALFWFFNWNAQYRNWCFASNFTLGKDDIFLVFLSKTWCEKNNFQKGLNMIFVPVKKKIEKHPCKIFFVWKRSLTPPKRWSDMFLPRGSCWLCNFCHVALTWHGT